MLSLHLHAFHCQTGGSTMYETDQYEGMLAETVVMQGAQGATINAYFARPLGSGPFPGMVVVHHMPGWDEWYREATRRFAHHGYAALCPNLFFRAGHGTPEDVAAKVRGQGGIPDDQAVGDLAGALDYLRALPYVSRKVGIFGTCSGGRHAYLAACRTRAFDAVVDCWGGGVVMGQEALTPNHPVAPIDFTKNLNCPLLGLFGEQDSAPSPEQVATHERELQKFNKTYEFHMYPDAGHGFFYYHRPNYRPQQAVDGWEKIFAFLKQHL
jgi:carboxymethylenebutenolidase